MAVKHGWWLCGRYQRTGQYPGDNARGRFAEPSVRSSVGPSQVVLGPEANVIELIRAVYLNKIKMQNSQGIVYTLVDCATLLVHLHGYHAVPKYKDWAVHLERTRLQNSR